MQRLLQHTAGGDRPVKWVTRKEAHVDRIACPWLIRRFVDPDAQILFVPVEDVMPTAAEEGAIPFDIRDVELGSRRRPLQF